MKRHWILIVIAVVVVAAAVAAVAVATGVVTFGSGDDGPGWAGAVATGGPFSSVSATWVLPAVVKPVKPGSENSFWVGLDGYGSESVEQLGTQVIVGSDGTARYSAWWEMYPKGTVDIPDFPVKPGDVITASVTSHGDGRFTLAMENKTTGKKFSTVQHNDVTRSKSAEIVVERPSDRTGKKISLDSFAACEPVHFTDCTVDGKPIADASPKWLVIAGKDGAVLAKASAPEDGGAAFTVSRPD
jgi:hypothetical protein